MTRPKEGGWNRRQELEDQIASVNTAIAEQQNILLLTNQRDAYSKAVSDAAKKTINQLETTKQQLIKERNARR